MMSCDTPPKRGTFPVLSVTSLPACQSQGNCLCSESNCQNTEVIKLIFNTMTSESRGDNAEVLDSLWTNSTGKEDHRECIVPGRKLILSNTQLHGCRAGKKASFIIVQSFPRFPWARNIRKKMYNHPSYVTVQEKEGYQHSGRIIQPRRMKS